MISRVLPALTKLNRVVKITNIEKPSVLCLYEPSFKRIYPGALNSCGICVMANDELNDPKRHLDYNQLIERKGMGNVYIIDVREPSETEETGIIPGSCNIPLNDLPQALGEASDEEYLRLYNCQKPKKNDEIIFSCKSGKRSMKALKLALDLGYKKARSYDGGWTEWASKTKPS